MSIEATGAILWTTRNPATGLAIREYRAHRPEEVAELLTRAATAQAAWRKAPAESRSAPLIAIADALDANVDTLAGLMTQEMGKPMTEARGEVRKCAWVCRYYAEHGPAMLVPEDVATDADTFVRYDPLGVVLAIMPWNFPFWQVFRFAAPALMAGNALLIKHAPNTFGCAQAIEELVFKAGLPPGLLANVMVDVPAVEAIIRHPVVSAVTLTGSERAGRSVAAIAGSALKKSVLELGGSDPFIVFEDADLSAAVAGAVAGRCMNSGQSCCASKRFIVQESIADAFEAAFAAALSATIVGPPEAEDTQIGPLARPDLRDQLQTQVDASLAAGARLVCGGGPTNSNSNGYFFAPTLIADVTAAMPVWSQETFGPVAAMRRFETLEEAVALANDSIYGLCATVWTADGQRARDIASALDVGGVFANRIAGSDPRLPFGGIKASGYGRELGLVGLREFVNVKTVWIA